MVRTLREEVLHLLISQMRPVALSHLLLSGTRTPEHSRLIAFFPARAAQNWAMVRARREEMLHLLICQMRPV
eukprot:8742547-Pyramimonas_sp.AAC.1